jgi:O-antigen chain-terminating methyltransferase
MSSPARDAAADGADRASPEAGGVQHADAEQPAHLAAFYEAHQERFRGPRETVRRRLEIYLPHVQAVASPSHPVLDIGPGRGEWLALLGEQGVTAYGVDVNAAFVAAGVEMGLDIRHQDAIEHLKQIPDGSLSAITAFHVVEHIPLSPLVDLVDHSLRALRPGGLLILETPNPLNVMVGAAWFHMDPTHIKPLPPPFLEFVLENRGFTGVRVLMANPPDEPPLEIPAGSATGSTVTVARMAELLNRAFFVGMDFAVIGRRADPAEHEQGSSQPEPETARLAHQGETEPGRVTRARR